MIVNRFNRYLPATLLAFLVLLPLASHGAESMLEKLMRVTGISLGPGQLRDEDGEPGSLWVIDISGTTAQRWTAAGGFRSPVFATTDSAIYALNAGALVRIDRPLAAPSVMHKLPGVQKLVGFDRQIPNDLIVLTTNPNAPLATLSLKTGTLTQLPFDKNRPEHTRLLGQIRSQNRAQGNTSANVETQRRDGLTRALEWTDIVVQRGGDTAAHNLSRCAGINCSQPAFSPDATKIAFVKAEP